MFIYIYIHIVFVIKLGPGNFFFWFLFLISFCPSFSFAFPTSFFFNLPSQIFPLPPVWFFSSILRSDPFFFHPPIQPSFPSSPLIDPEIYQPRISNITMPPFPSIGKWSIHQASNQHALSTADFFFTFFCFFTFLLFFFFGGGRGQCKLKRVQPLIYEASFKLKG